MKQTIHNSTWKSTIDKTTKQTTHNNTWKSTQGESVSEVIRKGDTAEACFKLTYCPSW